MAITISKNKFNRGAGLIEILVVIFLVVVGLVALLDLAALALKVSAINKQTVQANNLALEAIEAMRVFRDGTDWDVDGLGVLNIDVVYSIQKTAGNPPEWQFVTGKEEIDNFTRQVVFGRVFRDVLTDDIADAGAEDAKTRKATVMVSWADREIQLITYLTDWK